MSILDVVLDRKPEPKEEKIQPLTMYGEDYDRPSIERIPVYWQEPVLQEKDLFPEDCPVEKPIRSKPIPVLASGASYRTYTNNQF